jgi:hypothetical protein
VAEEIAALRRLRDRHLASNAIGRALIAAYEWAGPALADAIREHEGARAVVRTMLIPIIALAHWLDGEHCECVENAGMSRLGGDVRGTIALDAEEHLEGWRWSSSRTSGPTPPSAESSRMPW